MASSCASSSFRDRGIYGVEGEIETRRWRWRCRGEDKDSASLDRLIGRFPEPNLESWEQRDLNRASRSLALSPPPLPPPVHPPSPERPLSPIQQPPAQFPALSASRRKIGVARRCSRTRAQHEAPVSGSGDNEMPEGAYPFHAVDICSYVTMRSDRTCTAMQSRAISNNGSIHRGGTGAAADLASHRPLAAPHLRPHHQQSHSEARRCRDGAPHKELPRPNTYPTAAAPALPQTLLPQQARQACCECPAEAADV